MKNAMIYLISTALVIGIFWTLESCAADEECDFNGTTTSVGSSNGYCCYTLDLGAGTILYNSINNTFNPNGAEIVDVDKCLNDIKNWPSGSTTSAVTIFLNNGYVVRFNQQSIVKVYVDDYSNGVLTVTYKAGL